MAERISTGYKRLFEVRVLHHYFLDDGSVDFTKALPQPQNLAAYDIRPILSFEPTAATGKTLRGIHGVFRLTPLGLVVAVPAGVEVPADARFEFVVRIKDADFMNYTALTLRKQKTVDVLHNGAVSRFKENVFVLSNKTGVKRTISNSNLLCLSTEIPIYVAGQYEAEAFVSVGTGTELYQAIRDTTQTPPDVDWQKIDDNLNDRPLYVHQHDAPLITLPDGTPFRGIELTSELPNDIFALIQIDAATTNAGYQIIDHNKLPLSNYPKFEIHLKNRSTIWRYYEKSTGTYVAPWSAVPRPLTFNGNSSPAGTPRKKAAPTSLKIEMNGPQVAHIYTDIIE